MQALGKINGNDAEEGNREEDDKHGSHKSKWHAVNQRLFHRH